MSIPPLVCNTPPPPDQCEDDKDEDFDLQYRLSQEDDEDNDSYGYGNYSTYSDYCQQPNVNHNITTFKSEPENCSMNAEEKKICSETSDAVEFSLNENETIKNEDIAVEDLNLKIEQENIISNLLATHTLNNAVDPDTYGISCIVDHLDSPDKNNVVSNENEEDESSDEKSISETNITPFDTCDIQESSENTVKIGENKVENQKSNDIDIEQHLQRDTIQSEEVESEIKTIVTDEFDEFEEFKFTETAISNAEVTANFENPWDGNNDTEEFSFGDFKANFENNTDNIQPFKEQINNTEDAIVNKTATDNANVDLDDDFGDFDDFKSSVKQELEDNPAIDTELAHHVTVLNFQSPDNEAQIIESINNIIFNIFTEDLPDCQSEIDKTLDSMLTETWHHLKEVDERQPYMVHWNNSLGQKSLLKALCIDSRNILFGPKWNYFTPKYATSLSIAPLQPQKPAAVPNTGASEVVNSDKVTPKDTSWTDPFNSEGQDYTYAEALLLDLEHLMATLDQMAHKHSTLKISELLSTGK
ncbi:protein PFC0760c-like [Zerene cesonia]|uniref:protein PFC0760c-like n=1 Tax=Zerene cesonia TaxID=33412 RepID=UPI0018E4F37A|nr:protein PFC0760c-like [Zerene cesonia]